MKLKFELVNGYGVLVDEEVEINEGDLILVNYKIKTCKENTSSWDRGTPKIYIKNPIGTEDTYYNIGLCKKIIFAEKELNLEDVLVFEWRDFEVWQKSKEVKHWGQFASTSFVKGYKSNPAKFTEEDLRKAMDYASQITNNRLKYIDDYVKSLQKYPKWVVMESDDWEEYGEIYTLLTNSEGKQQGTVKELIWE
jgi:hypothetical protein